MPPLKNQKRELFCLRYIESGCASRAAALAGYSARYSKDRAYELMQTLEVKARIAELQEKAEDDKIMSVIERKQRLSEIARARVSDFVTCRDGVARINVTLDSAHSAALQEVVSEELQTGKGENAPAKLVTRLKLRDPVAAIAELNKMEKVYDAAAKANVDLTQVTLKVVYEDDRTRIRDHSAAAAPQTGGVYLEPGQAEGNPGG